MGILESLVSGERKQMFEDLASRFEQGAPWEGVGDDEARERHDEVAREASPDQYERAAREAFERFSPQDRRKLGRQVAEHASARASSVPRDEAERLGDSDDSGSLAKLMAKVQRENPELVSQVLGAVGGGLGKGALAGIASMLFKQVAGKR
jgi:hypothetical protein